jgi:hypothetical protein
MRRIIPLSILVLTLFGSAAFADRDRHGGGRDRDRGDRGDRRSGGVIVRDQRGPVVVRDRDRGRPGRRAVVRNRVYVNNGRYVFGGGYSRTYVRPVIRQRYYDVRYRPTIIVENMEPVPGYVWIRGAWQWNGGAWQWVSGHYEPDTRYSNWYDDGSYDLTVSGGVTVGGGY